MLHLGRRLHAHNWKRIGFLDLFGTLYFFCCCNFFDKRNSVSLSLYSSLLLLLSDSMNMDNMSMEDNFLS